MKNVPAGLSILMYSHGLYVSYVDVIAEGFVSQEDGNQTDEIIRA